MHEDDDDWHLSSGEWAWRGNLELLGVTGKAGKVLLSSLDKLIVINT